MPISNEAKLTDDIVSLMFMQPTDLVVCDPCYIFDHRIPELDKAWQDMCGEWYPEGAENADYSAPHATMGIIVYKGTKCLYTSTAHGDGTYRVDNVRHGEIVKNSIPVDAGMICVISQTDLHKINPKFKYEDYCRIKNFTGLIISTGTGFREGLVVNTNDMEDDDE